MMAFCHDEVRRSPRSNRREVVEEFWVDLGRIKVIEMVEAYGLVGELFLLFSSLVERESKISFFFYFFSPTIVAVLERIALLLLVVISIILAILSD
jgi:hypothetical protein